ncbi:unnamed protein product [Nippostrongylus brasiliensis]|uniref:Nuclear hormone receptor family member nhr-48 (inferred by orthology to a C. elegans protein) n=1 Tax=Nippostrongylus brasiliensis TaxID=27835 RepID=A0A158QYJ8_NIPBR|nr:unnamed protein product [Nippostrongylus brasiliensis]
MTMMNWLRCYTCQMADFCDSDEPDDATTDLYGFSRFVFHSTTARHHYLSCFDSSAEKPVNRKRTNTASSGGGEKRTANKICRVCGDKAFSYNFNVITCESCKAFFRRNANKEREIRCPFNEQCEINVVSRRFCQRCRLAKCFDVGMKKEWIMSDEARLEKKQRVEENRERRMADAMARAEAIDDDDSNQHEAEVVERMRQRAALAQESCSMKIESGKMSDSRTEEQVSCGRPSDELFNVNSNQDHNAVPIVVPPLLEAGSTAVAQSLADVSATTTAAPTMDVDPATTMSSSGFIPPAVESGLLVMPPSNPVDPSFMAAQAQLAAAAAAQVQVQAAINQHQIAAAVVQQVAAHIVNAAPVAAPVPAPIPPTLNQVQPPILAPAPSTSLLLTPSLNPITPMTDMVTIPREVLVKLIENNPPRVNCTCQCTCGRYPPGCAIVDEVTKDLLAAGNNTSNPEPATTTANKDEAKLESAEDFHMNGLLPSDDSSVQWFNSCAPTVDPSAVADERPSGRRDSFYTNTAMVDTMINSVPESCIPYMVIHSAIGCDPNDSKLIGASVDVRFRDILPHCIRFYLTFKEEFRNNENVMLILALLAVFDAEFAGLQDKEGVSRQFTLYSSLLQRLIYSLDGSDGVRASADYCHLLERLRSVGEVTGHAITMSHELDATDIERLLLEL